jgi:transcriptional regulator with XRE-family HTH domain
LNVRSADLLTPVQGPADLRRLRVMAGRSARQVAERTHISVPTYARWESGHIDRMPATVALEALAEALGVSVDEVTVALAATRRDAG